LRSPPRPCSTSSVLFNVARATTEAGLRATSSATRFRTNAVGPNWSGGLGHPPNVRRNSRLPDSGRPGRPRRPVSAAAGQPSAGPGRGLPRRSARRAWSALVDDAAGVHRGAASGLEPPPAELDSSPPCVRPEAARFATADRPPSSTAGGNAGGSTLCLYAANRRRRRPCWALVGGSDLPKGERWPRKVSRASPGPPGTADVWSCGSPRRPVCPPGGIYAPLPRSASVVQSTGPHRNAGTSPRGGGGPPTGSASSVRLACGMDHTSLSAFLPRPAGPSAPRPLVRPWCLERLNAGHLGGSAHVLAQVPITKRRLGVAGLVPLRLREGGFCHRRQDRTAPTSRPRRSAFAGL